MIVLDLSEFLAEIRSSIKWSDSTGYHRCSGCGRQMDSTEKETHWPKHCSLSKDKKLQKLRADVLAANFPEEKKPALQEVGLDWYQNQIKKLEFLPIDLKATGAAINDTYLSIKVKQLSSEDIQDLTDLFSGKLKCRAKEVYTNNHDPIIDSIPMSDVPDPDMFSCPEWLKDHNRAISETYALGLYADSIKRGECDFPGCFCHELPAMKLNDEAE
jgi:hypothetical protein